MIKQWRDYALAYGAAVTLVFSPAVMSGQSAAKAASKSAAKKAARRGPVEKYDCKVGTENEHARIAILAQGGEVQSVAYYSKWKPRTCSIHIKRDDAYSRWEDSGDATIVTTEYGDFLIQVNRTEYQMYFRQVDRMHYCGMMGKLNGSMTVTRGRKPQCSVEGIMDRKDETEVQEGKVDPSNTAEIPGASPQATEATN